MTARAELVALLRRRVALLPVADRERYLVEFPRCCSGIGEATRAELVAAAAMVRREVGEETSE